MKKYLLILLLLTIHIVLQAQQREIKETVTCDLVPKSSKTVVPAAMGSTRFGVQSMKNAIYQDSLIRLFDKIEPYQQDKDTAVFQYYRATFGNDTLCYKERKPVIITSYKGKTTLEVESLKAPHQRFSVVIDGLTGTEISALKDSMQQMKTSDMLLNNEQTCIFYALNCLLDAHGINPAPIITRNTTFTDGYQLNAFFDHILTLKGSYPCKTKELRKMDLPDDCVLVFQNAHKEFIHAVFYRKDTKEYYTKNGFWSPVILTDLRPVTERYGRYDTKMELSKEGLDMQADTVLVYCLN